MRPTTDDRRAAPSPYPSSVAQPLHHPVPQTEPTGGSHGYINTKSLPNINSTIIQAANNKFLHLQTGDPPRTGGGGAGRAHAHNKHLSADRQKVPPSTTSRKQHVLSPHPPRTVSGSETLVVGSNGSDGANDNVRPRSSSQGSGSTGSTTGENDINGNPGNSWIPTGPGGLISPTRMYPSDYQPPKRPRTQQQQQQGRKPGCVFLRPEQNIPDVFGTKFKPIMPDSGGAAETAAAGSGGGGGRRGGLVTGHNVSRDDIVVTLRSVNV